MKKFVLLLVLLLVAPAIAFADCNDYTVEDCESFGCALSQDGTKCIYNNTSSNVRSCGDELLTNIPLGLISVTKITYGVIHVAVPVLLVMFGSLDLIKGVIAGKDDEIKKNQSMFIKRLIAAVLVFFVFSMVKFVISISADNGSRIIKCAECFIDGAGCVNEK